MSGISPDNSSGRPTASTSAGTSRARSSTIVNVGPPRTKEGDAGPPQVDVASGVASTSAREIPQGERKRSKDGDEHAGSHHSRRHAHGHGHGRHGSGASGHTDDTATSIPRSSRGLRLEGFTTMPDAGANPDISPPMPDLHSFQSMPVVPTVASGASNATPGPNIHGLPHIPGPEDVPPRFSTPANNVRLSLYTYSPSQSHNQTVSQREPSLLPAPASNASTRVLLSYASLPWNAKAGDYLEIRRVPVPAQDTRRNLTHHQLVSKDKYEVDATEGVKPGKGRDGYIFRLGEDVPSVPTNQIQVPNAIANAFKLQHRQDVEVIRIDDPQTAFIDFIELNFSQYVGRADMWRLGMSLENTTVHVGEKVTLAGGAVRADVQGVWRGRHQYSSGILTSKTKTIFRSKSAQTYIFIQLCEETWEFDEDGERYYEKVLHGFLPDLFQRWTSIGASHLVTIILFARVYYTEEEVSYLESLDLTLGLMKDYHGRWCKDFFHVLYDFERKGDWMPALVEIKKRMERSEREILLDFQLSQLHGQDHPHAGAKKRIVGRWSFAYEGNVLEAVNLALNPFDEHYIDRDLSRTGLSMTVLTPGTGHFEVDKNLLRLTTERMIDHGIGLDLVCLTKMPLHSVPLFSYLSERPTRKAGDDLNPAATKPATPDPLYHDSHPSRGDRELTDCYSLAFWVYCSFYSKTHDKHFRRDRFVPRCKMYEIQMLGILDHNLTTVVVPMLDVEDMDQTKKKLTVDDRKLLHDAYDEQLFGGGQKTTPTAAGKENLAVSPTSTSRLSNSAGTSYQSARLLSHRMEEERRAKPEPGSPLVINRGDRNRQSVATQASITEESMSNPLLPDVYPLSSGAFMPDIPTSSATPSPLPIIKASEHRRPSLMENVLEQRTPSSRITSTTSIAVSPSQSILSNDQIPSGASTPKRTPSSSVKKLKSQSSKGSFASRFASTWLFGSLATRAQPSVATAAVENIERRDVSINLNNGAKAPSPVAPKDDLPPPSIPQTVPGIGITRTSPGPAISPTKPRAVPRTLKSQPMPIASQGARGVNDELTIARSMPRSIPRSLHNSFKAARSMDDSWRNKTQAAFGRTAQHRTVNPCNPNEGPQDGGIGGHGRRWQHVRPRLASGKQHVVKWKSLCAPACLPLTTDFMPTAEEIATHYEAHSYDIACFPDQVSFLVRPDAAQINLPLAVMREMASQRLSQNFQFIVLPHNSNLHDDPVAAADIARHAPRNLLLGDSTKSGLRVGGASEVLKDASGAIYLSWSNHIHRLTFDPSKQSVTVQRFVRKTHYSTQPHAYKCLVWPYQMHGFQEATALFKYPNIDAKLNFNYLDRLIAGEEDRFQSNLRFWRTRYLLIPSGKDPNQVGLMPKGEQYQTSEILITGAVKVLELLGKNQWKRPGEAPKPLRLLATTFDPSACVLDEGLVEELERLTSGREKIEGKHTLEGMTLQQVADMMNKPNNGLIIRDRWWNFNVHEDSFTGEQFCEWLKSTFTDVTTREQAADWGQSLFEKGLIEHVTGQHNFQDTYFFYRMRAQYDIHQANKPKGARSWFGGKAAAPARLTLETDSAANATDSKSGTPARPLRLTERPAKKRKVKMSQSIVIDLDPTRKSDRAEVAMLHADIIHNTRNAFHFELNWLGVTAGLLEELRGKCSTLAERYGLKFVEAPVEQIKDVNLKCAYRSAIPIRLALAPPVIPDLGLRLAESASSGQAINYFEYAILTHEFDFVLDFEASDRYPDNIEVEYAYRSKVKFEYSQFCHKGGLALVQCVGGEAGYLWCDNRPFLSTPVKGRQTSADDHRGHHGHESDKPVQQTRAEQLEALRRKFEAFCADPVRLAEFYERVTPPPVGANDEPREDLAPKEEGELTIITDTEKLD